MAKNGAFATVADLRVKSTVPAAAAELLLRGPHVNAHEGFNISSGEGIVKMDRPRWTSLVICLGVGGPVAIATPPEIEGWYKSNEKPPWNPPDHIFCPVWIAIYIMMAVWLVRK